jgi:mycothiol synthase
MRQLLMHRENLLRLPEQPALTPGLCLRKAGEADTAMLCLLLCAAFADDRFTPEWIASELSESALVPTTFVIANGASLVATASVLLREDRAPDTGYLHWVAAAPEWQGARLGYAVSLAVLEELARLGRREVYLKTDDHRLPAIKTYSNLGFRGLVENDEDGERWATVARSIPSIKIERCAAPPLVAD